MTAGIAVGELCADCRRRIERKASRVGRIVAIVTTLLITGYVIFALRSVGPAWQATARIVGATAVVVWYLLTYRIVKRIALEWLK